MKHIVMTGNIIDGFQFIGPFDDRDDAVLYAQATYEFRGDWWLAELQAPGEEL